MRGRSEGELAAEFGRTFKIADQLQEVVEAENTHQAQPTARGARFSG